MMIDFFFDKVNEISAGCIILTTVGIALFKVVKGVNIGLDDLMSPALASATVPTGIALIICAFYPSYIPKLEQMNMYLSVAGIVVLFIAFYTIKSSLSKSHNKSIQPTAEASAD